MGQIIARYNSCHRNVRPATTTYYMLAPRLKWAKSKSKPPVAPAVVKK
jgi:hypothetical protein